MRVSATDLGIDNVSEMEKEDFLIYLMCDSMKSGVLNSVVYEIQKNGHLYS